jgi:hypothetical protein
MLVGVILILLDAPRRRIMIIFRGDGLSFLMLLLIA